MFESIVASVLNSALGKFIDGLDADALSISVFKGEVELFDLKLKDTAFDGLGCVKPSRWHCHSAAALAWRTAAARLRAITLTLLCFVAPAQCSRGPRGRQGGPHQAVCGLEEPQHEGNPDRD